MTVDSFPGEVFTGTVSHIADQAEFTPRNVQTTDSRKTTVFAIRLDLETERQAQTGHAGGRAVRDAVTRDPGVRLRPGLDEQTTAETRMTETLIDALHLVKSFGAIHAVDRT